MKHISLSVNKDGFYGAYWKCKNNSKYAIIAMLGDDCEDYMATCAAKWLLKKNINVLTMSPAKKNYSHCNYPLERISCAIQYLKDKGNEKIGICGASTTGTLALTAASYFPEITFTIAMTPSDFIWQGFLQGKKDGCKEWPVEGKSLFTYEGKPLPYMPFCYKHPEYWHVFEEECKKNNDMLGSKKIFDDSEALHPITEDEFIKVENIKGLLVLVGAEDDSLWDTAKYIRRIEKRLSEKAHECMPRYYVYKHGTHFVFPESLIRKIFPIFSGLFVKLFFSAAKKYPKECLQTRIDIDKQIVKAINDWRK